MDYPLSYPESLNPELGHDNYGKPRDEASGDATFHAASKHSPLQGTPTSRLDEVSLRGSTSVEETRSNTPQSFADSATQSSEFILEATVLEVIPKDLIRNDNQGNNEEMSPSDSDFDSLISCFIKCKKLEALEYVLQQHFIYISGGEMGWIWYLHEAEWPTYEIAKIMAESGKGGEMEWIRDIREAGYSMKDIARSILNSRKSDLRLFFIEMPWGDMGWVWYLRNAKCSEKDISRIVLETEEGGKMEWIHDLRGAGYSMKDIASSILESLDRDSSVSFQEVSSSNRLSPQIIESDWNFQTGYHQPNCAHTRFEDATSYYIPTSDDSAARTSKACDAQSVRGYLEACCGLAGVKSNDRYRHATFEGSIARINYGLSNTSTDEKYSLELQLVVLQETTADIVVALNFLQRSGLCCNRISVVVSSDAVSMQTLHYSSIRTYVSSLKKVGKMRGTETGLDEKSLSACAQHADTLIDCLMANVIAKENVQIRISRRWEDPLISRFQLCIECLHICSLLTQILHLSILSYAQAHSGDFYPSFLTGPLTYIILEGCRCTSSPKQTAVFRFEPLACMSELVGGPILVCHILHDDSTSPPKLPMEGNIIIGMLEDVIDTWGPGLVYSKPGESYGENVHSVMIGSGMIFPVGGFFNDRYPLYHWSQKHDPSENSKTCKLNEHIAIGAVKIHLSCPLDPERCRHVSEPYFSNLGTEADYWVVTERQLMLQGAQYVGVQLGNVYSKVKGRSLKRLLLDNWRIMPDFRILEQPWGLQVSLCTGLARRVPLTHLIQEPMFAYIDGLKLAHWENIKDEVRLAFNGTTDYTTWTSGLQGEERECLVKVISFFLEVLKDTGVDREGKQLSMLWPHETRLSHAITLQISKSNLWARLLKDSPSCATFAAVTSTCLVAPGHECRKKIAPTWTGHGALLSTAVSRVSIPKAVDTVQEAPVQWALKNGQQCWMEKVGGDIWVYTTKEPNSDTQLRVKINRFPKGLSIFRDWQVLRERQDLGFDAEEVIVFGTMA